MDRRILDFIFRTFVRGVAAAYLFLSNLFGSKKSNPSTSKKIAALPYSPKGWPGGHERIANWKSFFNNDDIVFDVFWASDENSFLSYYDNTSPSKQYRFYLNVFMKRVKLLSKLKKYDVVWIQRAFIPFYPFQDAYYERLLSKIHPNVIVDYYDADYESNYALTMNSIKCSSKITVSTPFLKNKFSELNAATHHLKMTIDSERYQPKSDYHSERIRIGWMGSPGNSKYLTFVKDQLGKIASECKVEFQFVCRKDIDLGIPDVIQHDFEDPSFNLQNWLQNIDIGIAPYFGNSDRLKAKSPMKSLEFMACGIPIVTSEHGVFDGMTDQKEFLLANNENEFYANLKELISSEQKRKSIGENGRAFFMANHTYKANYSMLKSILLE